MQQFGEITEYITDPSTPSIALNYRIRKEAEVALLKGKHFQDRTLSITWCTEAQLSAAQRSPHTRTIVLSTINNNVPKAAAVATTSTSPSTATTTPKSTSNNNVSHASTPSPEETKEATSSSPDWAAVRSDKADVLERTTVTAADDEEDHEAEGDGEEDTELDADDDLEPHASEDQLLEGDDEVITIVLVISPPPALITERCLQNMSGEQLGAELSEEALLQDDEEDDDENEDRSWRR